MAYNPKSLANLTGKGRKPKNLVRKQIRISPESAQWLESQPCQSEAIDRLIQEQKKSMSKTKFDLAFNNFFLLTERAESVFISATRASLAGAKYYLEFFDNGTYRDIPETALGKRYDSRGIIVPVPPLSEEEYNEKDELNSCFDNAVDAFKKKFEDVLRERGFI